MRLPAAVLAHRWEAGDIVVADNHALLHGRHAFAGGERRHIRRVNVHDPIARTFWHAVRESIRIRRPEFMVAEIPILLIPALLVSAPLLSARFAETVALFFLLFHFGDMANCLADRDLDAVYKTHLTEAVYGLGVRNVRIQLALTTIATLLLAAHLGYATGQYEILALVIAGLGLGAAYSIPPVRLKGRGLLQVLTLWAVIFVGPMLLVVRTFMVTPPAAQLLALVLSYGAMQEGIILVNTAEDLPEDTAAGIRTTAVALGLRRTLALATAMVAIGGAGVATSLASIAALRGLPRDGMVYLVPLACAYAWVVIELGLAWRLISTREQEAALAELRPRARRMPLWITATAWTTLFAAAAISYAGR
jgi:1,4-dihydroxy-2-naphthoate octaprenyltransferase